MGCAKVCKGVQGVCTFSRGGVHRVCNLVSKWYFQPNNEDVESSNRFLSFII